MKLLASFVTSQIELRVPANSRDYDWLYLGGLAMAALVVIFTFIAVRSLLVARKERRAASRTTDRGGAGDEGSS